MSEPASAHWCAKPLEKRITRTHELEVAEQDIDTADGPGGKGQEESILDLEDNAKELDDVAN